MNLAKSSVRVCCVLPLLSSKENGSPIRSNIRFSAKHFSLSCSLGGEIFSAHRFGGLWLKAVTEPNSARHTAIAEWIRPESTENDGSVWFSGTGI